MALSLPEEGRAVGEDAEGTDAHAVLLEDPISGKGDSRVTPSDLDTGHTERLQLESTWSATRAGRLLNA